MQVLFIEDYMELLFLSGFRNNTSSVTKCGWKYCRASWFFMVTSGNQKPRREQALAPFHLKLFHSFLSVAAVLVFLSGVEIVPHELSNVNHVEFQCCSVHLLHSCSIKYGTGSTLDIFINCVMSLYDRIYILTYHV